MAICRLAHWGVEGIFAPEFGLLIRAGELWQNRGRMWRRRLDGASASTQDLLHLRSTSGRASIVAYPSGGIAARTNVEFSK